MAYPVQAQASAGAPAPAGAGPYPSTERQLAGILQDLLDIDRIGVHDSFFELGGFSLHAAQLVARIRAAFRVELTLRDVFERPTVAELAPLIAPAQGSEDAP